MPLVARPTSMRVATRSEVSRRVNLAAETWKAICAAVATRKWPKFNLDFQTDRRRFCTFQALARHLLLSALARGPVETIKRVKSWTAQIREDVFLHGRCPPSAFRGLVGALGWTDANSHLQLSYIGRALPYGDATICEHALKSHADVLGSLGVTPPSLLGAARGWAKEWAIKNRLSLDLIREPPIQESSCLEYSRREGGYARAIKEHTARCLTLPPSSVRHSMKEGTRASNPGRVLKDLAFADLSNTARVVAVPERGWKARIVTAHAAARVAFLHSLRHGLFAALRNDRRTKLVAEGLHREAVEALFATGVDPRCTIVSADLSAASDTLHGDLLQAIVEGLGDALGCTSKFMDEFTNAAVGSYTLSYPDGSTVTTQRGALMGLPTTWPLLCLTHLFWCDQSLVQLHGRGGCREKETPGSSREAEVICGDDLAAAWRPDRVAAYEEIAVLCGAVFSPGKHLKSKVYGIFTEDIYSVQVSCVPTRVTREVSKTWTGPVDKVPMNLVNELGQLLRWRAQRYKVGKTGAFQFPPRNVTLSYVSKETGLKMNPVSVLFREWSTAIPLRWAVRAPKHAPGMRGDLPPWVTVPLAAHAVASAHPGRWSKVCRVVKLCYPGMAKFFASHGIPPYLPRVLGGGGLPTPLGDRVKIGRVASRRIRKALGGALYRSTDPTTFGSIWTTALSPAYALALADAQDLDAMHPDAFKVRQTRSLRPPFKDNGNYADFVEMRAGKGSLWALRQGAQLVGRSFTPSPARVSNALRTKVRKALAKRGYLRSSAPVSKLIERASVKPSDHMWIRERPVLSFGRFGGRMSGKKEEPVSFQWKKRESVKTGS
ncbi:RdRp [Point-Douro narna-like virus]|uniref:RdRp n=1 Tax=Point-Douro narna-like virus TaxID=2010279 RepID=UPI000B4EC0E2|nr:RdRp [Point-Douro narna-like virus]ASA47306.1 RdRp [Point-Douro narna-like virus]